MGRARKALAGLALAGAVVGLGTACSNDAEVVSHNISKAADNFEVQRQIVFYNGINGEFIAEVDGACSIDDESTQLEVTCKTGEDDNGDPTYVKDFLGLSDNVTYFVLQSHPIGVSTDHYRITFKPSTVVPDINTQ